ncbi:MAG: hypothetical protein CMIDDMOC_00579 [Sodalis sp. Fle]|nr:MAG: hypothetical protein CMIDDMOC_00579 [Sodalis sp. Fle]
MDRGGLTLYHMLSHTYEVCLVVEHKIYSVA